MPRQGNGNYVLPAANPVSPQTLVKSAWANSTLNDIAQALTQSISTDGQTAPTANLPMAGFNHTTVAPATASDQYARADQVQKNSLLILAGATMPSANTYMATLPLASATFAPDQVVYLLPPATNTGPSTLNVNATGAVPVQNTDGTPIVPGALTIGVLVPLWWAGTAWRMLTPSAVTKTAFQAVRLGIFQWPAGSTGLMTQITGQTMQFDTLNEWNPATQSVVFKNAGVYMVNANISPFPKSPPGNPAGALAYYRVGLIINGELEMGAARSGCSSAGTGVGDGDCFLSLNYMGAFAINDTLALGIGSSVAGQVNTGPAAECVWNVNRIY